MADNFTQRQLSDDETETGETSLVNFREVTTAARLINEVKVEADDIAQKVEARLFLAQDGLDQSLNLNPIFSQETPSGDSILETCDAQIPAVIPGSGIAVSEESDISDESDSLEEEILLSTSTEIPAELYDHLPQFLSKTLTVQRSKQAKDIGLVSTLAVLSACFPNVYGVYNSKEYKLNMYLIIVGPAGSGKSAALTARALVKKIDTQYRAKEKTLFFPADMSSALLLEMLKRNDGRGIIMASELDTMTQNSNKEWGNVGPLLRHGFEHETYESGRKGEKELVTSIINHPEISLVMTGTLNQVSSFIPSTEDGLFSRVCMYNIELDPDWVDVFPDSAGGTNRHLSIEEQLEQSIQDVKIIFDKYNTIDNQMFQFDLTRTQKVRFNRYFTKLSELYEVQNKNNAIATVRRMGVTCFRIAGILTVLRNYQSNPLVLVCNDEDLRVAFLLTNVFINNAFQLAKVLKLDNKIVTPSRMMRFYNALPDRFTYSIAIAVGDGMTIKESSVESYLKKLRPVYIDKPEHNSYIKVVQCPLN